VHARVTFDERGMNCSQCRGGIREGKREVVAVVVKGDLVRLEEVPLLLHVPGLGVHARGTRVVLEVMSVDELTWNDVSDVPLKVTLVAPVKFVPWTSTCVPTGPLVGLNDVTDGGLPPPFVQLGNLKAPIRVCQRKLPVPV